MLNQDFGLPWVIVTIIHSEKHLTHFYNVKTHIAKCGNAKRYMERDVITAWEAQTIYLEKQHDVVERTAGPNLTMFKTCLRHSLGQLFNLSAPQFPHM